MTCRSVLLPDPEGPTIATSSPRRTEKDTPRKACTGGCSPYTLVTPSSSRAGSLLMATAPPRRRPAEGHPRPGPVRLRCRTGPAVRRPTPRGPPSCTTSTANPPPDVPTSEVTGTLRASSTPLVVMSTWTGAASRPRTLVGSSRLTYAGRVAVAASGSCPVVVATLPMRATFPVTDVFPGSVTSARSPCFTSPCWDASRATCTSGRSDVACATGVPGRAGPPRAPVTWVIRTGPGRKTTSSVASSPDSSSPVSCWSFSSACWVFDVNRSPVGWTP